MYQPKVTTLLSLSGKIQRVFDNFKIFVACAKTDEPSVQIGKSKCNNAMNRLRLKDTVRHLVFVTPACQNEWPGMKLSR